VTEKTDEPELYKLCSFIDEPRLCNKLNNQSLVGPNAMRQYVNSSTDTGMTPLMNLSRRGKTEEMLEILIKNGAETNKTNHHREGALFIACQHGEKENALMLLNYGANIHQRNIDGKTPLHTACEYTFDSGLVDVLIQNGAYVNARDTKDNTPLIFACQQGNFFSAQLLIENGANVDDKNKDLDTPLHFACHMSKELLVSVLIEHGADLNCLNKANQTPLELAKQNGSNNIIQLLMDAQNQRHQCDNNGHVAGLPNAGGMGQKH
jgi:serine/threonine-protein phosphatase 6 regulatory ankyrin repeat subunit B